MAPDRAARANAVERATRHAPFLAALIERRPDLVEAFLAGGVDAAQSLVEPMPVEDAAVMDGLRRRRADLALLIALADLSGDYDHHQTVTALSDFADAACERALAAAFAERAPGEAMRGFAVIALGKQGSRELNYSSDIDPILIYDPETLPRRQRDDPSEAATRLARRWVEILANRTGTGHVMRVDLRLRPSPEVTPIALPIEAAISYYESQALAWEQAAFIRARCCAGDMALGQEFLSAIRPFIWRSVRDFGQLSRIADMSARIRDHYGKGQVLGPGFDLKRGRGGIREVEFFAQAQQLIHGGRNPALRSPRLHESLPALADVGLVEPAVADRLIADYELLRTIEHRLQMVADQQTHSLPDAAPALDNVAQLHGLADGAALIDLLRPVIAEVGGHFDTLLAGMGAVDGWPMDDGALADAVAATGFPDIGVALRRIAEWRGGGSRVLRSAAAREALEQVLPALFQALAAAPDPAEVLARFDNLVGGLPSAVNLFTMLAARPQLLASLVAILAHAPTLSAQLGRRAELLEGLIDTSAYGELPARAEVLTRLAKAPPGESYEQLLDRVRREVGELRFMLGVQLVEGIADPLAVARAYSDVAEAALETLVDATVAEFEAAHGRVPDAELLILALGRLGGQALTHASDLDLILLFSGDHMAESDGRRPLGATTYFNRLSQRVIAALSVATAAGPLYEVDTRLRPQGNQGPLCASVDAFARYQREDAWTWEHLALIRARSVYGSVTGRAALDTIIADVLHRSRDPAKLHADVAQMRRDVHRHKPAAGPLDVKLIDGGLVDLEFGLHHAQLASGTGLVPGIDAGIAALADAGIAPSGLIAANALMTRMLVCLRLMAEGAAVDDPSTRARIATACGVADWDALLAGYAAARAAVSAWLDAQQLND